MDILPQLLVNALITGSIYALISSGLSLTYGQLRILNFGHGHVMMVGAYIYYLFSVLQGFGAVLAGVLCVIAAGMLAMFTLRVFILPFATYSVLLPLVTTLAFGTIAESLISMIFGVNVKSLSVGEVAKSIEIYGVYITPIQIVIIASAVVLLCLLAFIIHYCSVGRRLRALSQHEYAARALGVNQRLMYHGVFTVSVLLAVYAGILVGLETNIQPTMGNAYTIKAFAAMILGGLGNVWGTVVGSYILGLVENLSIGLEFGGVSIPAGYKDAFAFLVILIVLLFKPEGIFTKRQRKGV